MMTWNRIFGSIISVHNAGMLQKFKAKEVLFHIMHTFL